MVMGREHPTATHHIMQVLGYRPRDRQPIVGAGPPANLIEDDQRPRGRTPKDARGFAHFHHEGALALAEVIPICACAAGTKHPACAITTEIATWRIAVDFPDIFGPVTIIKRSPFTSSVTSFGTKRPEAAICSTMGWRDSERAKRCPASICGRVYP